MKSMYVSSAIGVLAVLACLIISIAAVAQVTTGNWTVTATAAAQRLTLPAVAQIGVSIKNTSIGFAWVELTRPDGTALEHRIDPNSSMTLHGEFTNVVVRYHVPRGSQARPASGTWRIVGLTILEPGGMWYVDPNVNGTATIYSSEAAPPATKVTVKNNGPDTVKLLIKTSTGAFLPRISLKKGKTAIIPLGVPNWPAGATISEVIVEWFAGGVSTGTYEVYRVDK